MSILWGTINYMRILIHDTLSDILAGNLLYYWLTEYVLYSGVPHKYLGHYKIK